MVILTVAPLEHTQVEKRIKHSVNNVLTNTSYLPCLRNIFGAFVPMPIWCYVKSLEDKFVLLGEGFGYNKLIEYINKFR